MPFRYLDDIATADVAFHAWGAEREELFRAAADALMNVMVADLDTISPREAVAVTLADDSLDLLLFAFLQELVYLKDARRLLLRFDTGSISLAGPELCLAATLVGERIDPARHDLLVDVKAVTLHRFRVERTPEGWEAEVVLDI